MLGEYTAAGGDGQSDARASGIRGHLEDGAAAHRHGAGDRVMQPRDRLIVALDLPSVAAAERPSISPGTGPVRHMQHPPVTKRYTSQGRNLRLPHVANRNTTTYWGTPL